MGGRKAKDHGANHAAKHAAAVRARLAAAISLHQGGQLEQAEKVYLAVLAADQSNPDALHYLGVVRYQQGQPLLAIELMRRAIEISPRYVDAYNNLGKIFLELGNPIESAKACKMTLALRPDHPQAKRNLAVVQGQLERLGQEAAALERAIEREPADVDSLYALAEVYRKMGRFDEGIGTLKAALAAKPDPESFRRLGAMQYGRGQIEEAAATYEAWLRIDPESPVARHMLAACTLKDVPARAGDAFVTQVFDGFAESFERVLHRLEYRAPALVGEALQRAAGEPRGELSIVDAGCGTGLLAEYLRPYARRLVGVDLSPKMLEQAGKRATYDELVTAELASYLRSAPQAFDIVASSDTLVYFGELREALAAARASLRPGGRLVFTLELAAGEEPAEGYRIQPHGRYAHTRSYVRKALAEADFEGVEIAQDHLRREGAAYVEGMVVAARASDSPGQ